MYKKLNDSNIIKWLVRLLITTNFISSVIVRNKISEYFIEGFVLVLFAIWFTWLNKNFIAFILMLICIYTFYIHW